jgi:hypothetical protein
VRNLETCDDWFVGNTEVSRRYFRVNHSERGESSDAGIMFFAFSLQLGKNTMRAACWLRLCSCAVLVLVMPFSVAQVPANVHRESVADFVAKLNPAQKDLFEQASKAFSAGHFTESLGLHKQLLKDFPDDPILCKFASEDAINTGDPAATSLKPIAASDPDDWQITALLVHACAESGDRTCRDTEMAKMVDLHKRGLTPNQLNTYPVENVKLDSGTLLIENSLVPWSYYKVYALGKMSDASGKRIMTITLESSDMDQIAFAREHPAEAAHGARMFSLDAYRETGLNSEGKRTQTHFTYKFLMGQPDYATIRQDFLDIATGKSKPVSSRSGLVVQ